MSTRPPGGTWRVGGVADHWSRCELGWHRSPTANQHDAIAAVELALAEAEGLLEGAGLVEHLTDPDTGEIVPITLVTDNGGSFRSFQFDGFIAARPELRHVRTRVRPPGQNGVRERAFQSLRYERLYRQPIDDTVLDAGRKAGGWRSTILGGEGLVTDFRGPGRLWLRTRRAATSSAGSRASCRRQPPAAGFSRYAARAQHGEPRHRGQHERQGPRQWQTARGPCWVTRPGLSRPGAGLACHTQSVGWLRSQRGESALTASSAVTVTPCADVSSRAVLK